MDTYNEDIHKIEEGLNRLNDKEYISESTISFFRDIIRAQYKVKKQLGEIKISTSLTEEKVKEMMIKGIPLIAWNDIPLKESSLKELFREICVIIEKQENSKVEEIQRLINAERDGEFALGTLIEKLFSHDSVYFQTLAGDSRVSEEMLLFITLHMARPFFEAVAEKLNDKVMDDLWIKNRCPVCGSEAQMARLEKEVGKKMLYCSLCGTEWRFVRIKCPFCCTEEQKKLKFLEEEESPYRIDICDQCKRYIKTLDERKGGGEKREFIPLIEDLATMYLDIAAEKEGYERSWFFPPSVNEVKTGEGYKKLH